MKNIKIQMVMAHPDDEIIFGWPELMHDRLTSILICSDDADNPERPWCRHRGDALVELGALLNIPVRALAFNSEFYRAETRGETLKRMMQSVTDAIDPEADAIFTHNPWGEYGHLDHIIIHQAVMATGKPVFFTDIFVQSNWMHMPNRPHIPWMHAYNARISLHFYDHLRAIYERHGVWTWNQTPITECSVYLTKPIDKI
jgi:LmbE family N-acetylglucosaminyl deacetylase